MTDYYTILQISEQASLAEIKAAYRRMALQYHPDRNPDSNTLELFNEVQKAYEVLSDPIQRRQYDLKRNIEQTMPGMWEDVEPMYAGERIRMVVSKQFVKAGQPFSVHFRCPRKVDYFKLAGLDNFEIVKSVEHDLYIAGKTITEAHYVLHTLDEGEFVIGPATAGVGEIVYRSKQEYIVAEGFYKKPKMSLLAQILPLSLIVVTLAFAGLIVYNISTYGIRKFNEPEEAESAAVKKVFDEYRPQTGELNGVKLLSGFVPAADAYNQLTIVNNRKDDAVVLLIEPAENKPVYAAYVRSGSQANVGQIRPHAYIAYIASGTVWMAQREPIGIYKIKGRFVGNEREDFAGMKEGGIIMEQKRTRVSQFYTKYHLTIQPVTAGNAAYTMKKKTAYF